jgi:prevent-host-death family protein
MHVTATQAKNSFGRLCAQAKKEAVIVEKDGRPDSVILSYEQFQSLQSAGEKKSPLQRQREFNEKYKDWIAEQNRHFEKYGVFGEEYRSW